MSDILDRVRKLVALAADSDTEEARTAAHKACKLIKEHKLLDGQPARAASVPTGTYPRPPGGRNPLDDLINDFAEEMRRATERAAREAQARARSAPPPPPTSPFDSRTWPGVESPWPGHTSPAPGGWQHTQSGNIHGAPAPKCGKCGSNRVLNRDGLCSVCAAYYKLQTCKACGRKSTIVEMPFVDGYCSSCKPETRPPMSSSDRKRARKQARETLSGFKTITAEWGGRCQGCLQAYPAGTRIRWKAGEPTWHPDCFATRERDDEDE